jgi:hypothetical protein
MADRRVKADNRDESTAFLVGIQLSSKYSTWAALFSPTMVQPWLPTVIAHVAGMLPSKEILALLRVAKSWKEALEETSVIAFAKVEGSRRCLRRREADNRVIRHCDQEISKLQRQKATSAAAYMIPKWQRRKREAHASLTTHGHCKVHVPLERQGWSRDMRRAQRRHISDGETTSHREGSVSGPAVNLWLRITYDVIRQLAKYVEPRAIVHMASVGREWNEALKGTEDLGGAQRTAALSCKQTLESARWLVADGARIRRDSRTGPNWTPAGRAVLLASIAMASQRVRVHQGCAARRQSQETTVSTHRTWGGTPA